MFTEFIGGGRYRYQAERRMLRADGTDAWCHITMNVPVRRMIPDGNWFDRAVGVVEDVSDRKRLEGELRTRNAELSRMARTDPLTGLYNRLHLEERLQEAVSAARRHGSDLSIVLADVDRFKRVNDCHGHQAGDEVLRVVAERVRSMKRAEDVCCRWGGEEFLVMLPNTDAAGAVVFAERLRRTVRAHPAVTAGGTEIDVTVSVGVASGTGDVSDLLRRADMAL